MNEPQELLNEDQSLLSNLFNLDIITGGKVRSPKPKPVVVEPGTGKFVEAGVTHSKHIDKHGEASKPQPMPIVDNKDKEKDNDFDGFGGWSNPYKQAGGGKLVTTNMFHKLGLLYLMVVVVITLATIIFLLPPIYNRFFDPNQNEDASFDDPDATHSSRTKRIAMAILVYHLLVVVSFIVVWFVMKVILGIRFQSLKDKKGLTSSQYFKQSMMTFESNGERVSLTDFYMALIIIIIFGYFFYMFYFRHVLSYFNSLRYPDYVDPEKTSAEEMPPAKKFILMYGLGLLYIVAFVIMITNLLHVLLPKTAWKKTLFLWNSIFLMLAMIFVSLMYKNAMSKDGMKWIVSFIALLAVVFLNGKIARALVTVVQKMERMFIMGRS